MRYAIDTNIIVYAVAHHLGLRGMYPARYVASARVFSRRMRVPVLVPACFLGEAIQGAGTDQHKLDMVVALCVKGRAHIVEPTRRTLVNAILLRKQLRREDASRVDCLGYTIATQGHADCFVSYDTGFVGAANRRKVPQAYRQVVSGTQPPECYTAEEIMKQRINPRKRARKDPMLIAWERRASAAARAAGATTDLEVARFFCGTAKAFLETYRG